MGERGAAAAAARRCMAEVQGGWHAFERCVARGDGGFWTGCNIQVLHATLSAYKQTTGKTVRRREQPRN